MSIGTGIAIGLAMSQSHEVSSFSGLLGTLLGIGIVFVLGLLMVKNIDKIDAWVDKLTTKRKK